VRGRRRRAERRLGGHDPRLAEVAPSSRRAGVTDAAGWRRAPARTGSRTPTWSAGFRTGCCAGGAAVRLGVPRAGVLIDPGARLRQEHLALAGGDPAARRAGATGGRCWCHCRTRTSSARCWTPRCRAGSPGRWPPPRCARGSGRARSGSHKRRADARDPGHGGRDPGRPLPRAHGPRPRLARPRAGAKTGRAHPARRPSSARLPSDEPTRSPRQRPVRGRQGPPPPRPRLVTGSARPCSSHTCCSSPASPPARRRAAVRGERGRQLPHPVMTPIVS